MPLLSDGCQSVLLLVRVYTRSESHTSSTVETLFPTGNLKPHHIAVYIDDGTETGHP
jgi:hypothetical protein